MNFHGIFAEYTSMSHFNMTEYRLMLYSVQCTLTTSMYMIDTNMLQMASINDKTYSNERSADEYVDYMESIRCGFQFDANRCFIPFDVEHIG